mgnify:FL=1
MNNSYTEVPTNIVTGKDLDYLSDMFEWNYGALKNVISSIENVESEEIISLLEEGKNLFKENITTVLNLLNEAGDNNE